MKLGDFVYDKDDDVYGIIKEMDDELHNVYVIFENDEGSALYCLNPECEEYDGDTIKIIEGK